MSDQSGAMRRLMASDRERLDRLSRQLRIDQTARAVFAALTAENTATSAAPSIASVAYDRAEILEAERERRQKGEE